VQNAGKDDGMILVSNSPKTIVAEMKNRRENTREG